MLTIQNMNVYINKKIIVQNISLKINTAKSLD